LRCSMFRLIRFVKAIAAARSGLWHIDLARAMNLSVVRNPSRGRLMLRTY
jgi:hypothetical protein